MGSNTPAFFPLNGRRFSLSTMKKVNMITRIVRLRQFVRRWKTKSLSRLSDSDEQAASNRRTPSGSLAVYVGPERCRFVIPTRFLNLPVFLALLEEAEEEFGFQTAGGLVLPCQPDFFAEIVRLLEEDEEKFCPLRLDEFLSLVSGDGFEYLKKMHCKESSGKSFPPLLQKTRV